MTPLIKFGLLILIALSAGAAVYVSVLISRRQDLPASARRAFLYSNVALILCLAAAIAGIAMYSTAHVLGNALLAAAGAFLILKFIFVRQFAHQIRQSRAGQPQRSQSSSGS